MGKKISKFRNPRVFTEEEMRLIQENFEVTRSEMVNMSAEALKVKWHDYMLDTTLNEWLRYLFPISKKNLDWNRFTYLHKGQGSHFLEEKAQAIVRVLVNVPKEEPLEHTVEVEKVKAYFRDVIASYLRSLGSYENADFFKWLKIDATTFSSQLADVINSLTADLKSDDIVAKDVEDWLRTKPIISDILNGLLNIAYGIVDITNVPCVLPKPLSYFSTILDISQVIFLCAHLTKMCTKNWKLRFHNQGHGSNYTLLCKTILGVGPNLLIIKDHGNHIFGCFASESWKQSTQFYGDNRCFLFQLSPVLRLFEPSGTNNNFMYHNSAHHTYPNGFGMGGQIGFFGLWVDGDFGHGICSDFCSTFTNFVRPSVSPQFTFTHIEVWAVADDSEDDDKNLYSRLSITESDPFARALIEITRRGTFE